MSLVRLLNGGWQKFSSLLMGDSSTSSIFYNLSSLLGFCSELHSLALPCSLL
jgi:hypothetical protein